MKPQIFKKFIQYKIFDYCINVFFEHVKNNMNIGQKVSNEVPVIGNKYKKIIGSGGFEYYDCSITNVWKSNDAYNNSIMVEFTSKGYYDASDNSYGDGHISDTWYLSHLKFYDY